MHHILALFLFLSLPTWLMAAGEPQDLVPSRLEEPLVPRLPAPHKEAVVEKNELAAPVLTSYGTLDEKSGSLAMDIWKDISYADATTALKNAAQKMNSNSGNPVLADMLRRAALSKAYEPEGEAEQANSFFNARVFGASATGDVDNALQLLQKRPEAFKVNDWQSLIETQILQGRIEKACAMMNDHLVNDSSAFSHKMGILCEIKNQKNDAARLHMDLLREAGETDMLFLELAEKALNPKTKVTQKMENLSALHMALLVVGKIKLSAEQAALLTTLPQRLFIELNAPEAFRIKMIEHFARLRQLTRNEIETLFSAIKIPAKTIAHIRATPDALSTLSEKELPSALRRVAIMRAIVEEDSQSAKAHIMAVALSGFSNADLLGTLGDSLLTDAEGIAPLPDNAFAAPALLRLLLLRDGKDTQSWWKMTTATPSAREALLALFPLALYRGMIAEDDRGSWFESFGRTQNLSAEKKSLSLALVKMLGVMLPSDMESQLASQNMLPSFDAQDKKITQLLGTISDMSNEALLRSVQALNIIRQDKLAQMLALRGM